MIKPMLAATVDNLGAIPFPVIASPKLDGIRMIIHPELGAVTRSLKPIPNRHIRSYFSRPELAGLDGELVVGENNTIWNFNDTQSAVMSRDTTPPPIRFVVFDSFNKPAFPYFSRIREVEETVKNVGLGFSVQVIESTVISNVMELMEYESKILDEGFEGVMLRKPDGPYKFGRSTAREFILTKLKQHQDAEAEIVGVEWLNVNLNEAKTNELGRTQRSSDKSGLMADNTRVGALVVKGVNGEFIHADFKIGTGFDTAERERLANLHNRGALVGQYVSYTYQAEGSKDAPRFPRYKGLRHPDDFEAGI